MPAPATFTQFIVLGFPSCPWFHRASCIVGDLAVSRDRRLKDQVEPSIQPSDRASYAELLEALADRYPNAKGHSTCPAVLAVQCKRDPTSAGVTVADAEYECDSGSFVGGYSEFEQLLKQRYGFTSKRCDDLGRMMTGSAAAGCPAPPTRK